jgi:hypothetical protein
MNIFFDGAMSHVLPVKALPLVVDEGPIAWFSVLEVEFAQAVPQHCVVAGQHLEEHRKASEIDSAISADVIWGI